MKAKKILKVIGIIVGILIILILIHTIRNYVIIKDLQNKITQYSNSLNYYLKTVTTENNGIVVTYEYYKKDNKQVVFLERNLNGEVNKISMYNNGERIDTFTETKDSKIAQLNSESLMWINICNGLEMQNDWQTFLGSIFAKVKSTNYNGKECYIIKGYLSSISLNLEGTETYIEKDTGLLLKNEDKDIMSEREYVFNNVKEEIFVEPDISKYTLK